MKSECSRSDADVWPRASAGLSASLRLSFSARRRILSLLTPFFGCCYPLPIRLSLVSEAIGSYIQCSPSINNERTRCPSPLGRRRDQRTPPSGPHRGIQRYHRCHCQEVPRPEPRPTYRHALRLSFLCPRRRIQTRLPFLGCRYHCSATHHWK